MIRELPSSPWPLDRLCSGWEFLLQSPVPTIQRHKVRLSIGIKRWNQCLENTVLRQEKTEIRVCPSSYMLFVMQSQISLGQLAHIMTCLGLKVYDLGDDYRLAQTLLLVIVQHDLVNFKHLVVLESPFAQWHRKSYLWFLFRHLSAPSSVFPVIITHLFPSSHQFDIHPLISFHLGELTIFALSGRREPCGGRERILHIYLIASHSKWGLYLTITKNMSLFIFMPLNKQSHPRAHLLWWLCLIV